MYLFGYSTSGTGEGGFDDKLKNAMRLFNHECIPVYSGNDLRRYISLSCKRHLLSWMVVSFCLLVLMSTANAASSQSEPAHLNALQEVHLKSDDLFEGRSGKLQIIGEYGEMALAYGGVAIEVPELAGAFRFEKAFSWGGDDLVLLVESLGGSACPALYRLVVVNNDTGVSVLPKFGNCSDELERIKIEGKSIVVAMAGFVGPYEGDEGKEIADSINVKFTITRDDRGNYQVNEKIETKPQLSNEDRGDNPAHENTDNSPLVVIPNPFGEKLTTTVDWIMGCLNKNERLLAKFENRLVGPDRISIESATGSMTLILHLSEMSAELAKKAYNSKSEKAYKVAAVSIGGEYTERSTEIFNIMSGLLGSSCAK